MQELDEGSEQCLNNILERIQLFDVTLTFNDSFTEYEICF